MPSWRPPMANRLIARESDDTVLGERTSSRIRALLARTRPLSGNEVPDEYWDGRQLVESLALAFYTRDEAYHWSPVQCGLALTWLSLSEPIKGSCFCNDPSDVNATCGLQALLEFIADEMGRFEVTGSSPEGTGAGDGRST